MRIMLRIKYDSFIKKLKLHLLSFLPIRSSNRLYSISRLKYIETFLIKIKKRSFKKNNLPFDWLIQIDHFTIGRFVFEFNHFFIVLYVLAFEITAIVKTYMYRYLFYNWLLLFVIGLFVLIICVDVLVTQCVI